MSVAGELAGQTAIVTGGASGIGRATALQLARHGAGVAVLGRDGVAGHRVVGELRDLGVAARFVRVDLAQHDALAPAVREVVDDLGGVDILVNNAATRGLGAHAGRTRLFETGVDDWDFVQAVNVRAPFILIREVGRHMVERGRGGRIVNVTSSAAFQTANCSPHYAASKAALTSLTRTAAAELGPHGITVNAVAPSLTRTPFRERPDDPDFFERSAKEGPMANLLRRPTEADDVAAVITFLCLPAGRQLTAQTIHPSAGLIAH